MKEDEISAEEFWLIVAVSLDIIGLVLTIVMALGGTIT